MEQQQPREMKPRVTDAPPTPQAMHRGDLKKKHFADVPLLPPPGEDPFGYQPPLPYNLHERGVSHTQFASWVDTIHESQRVGSPFADYPVCGLCYWCCPLLCFQPLVCMACPTTWYLSIREVKARDAAEDEIRAQSPEGLHFRWTIWQHMVWETSTIYELRTHIASTASSPVPTELPAQLAKIGASQEQWERWRELLEAERRAQLLHSCHPYVSFCYSFFPLGALQPCVCLLNPLTCYNARRISRAREAAERGINAELGALGAHFRYASSDRSVLFVRGPLPPELAKKRRSTKGLAMVSIRAMHAAHTQAPPPSAAFLPVRAGCGMHHPNIAASRVCRTRSR